MASKAAEVLTFVCSIGLVISWCYSSVIDEKPLTIAGFVFSLSPLYWVFLTITLISLFYAALRGKEKLIIVLIIILAMYSELPRLIFTQPYQLEAFHQAQVYHVVREGSALDANYPMPEGSVVHSIMWAMEQLVTGVDVQLLVLFIVPILLMVSSALILYSLFRKPLGILMSSVLTVFFLAFSVEVIYTNHYGQLFPYYALFWPLLIRLLTSKTYGRHYFALLLVITTALTLGHYGASFSLSLFLLMASITIFLGASAMNSKFSFKRWTGFVALACNLLLWSAINPGLKQTIGTRIIMMVDGFMNLLQFSFPVLDYPEARFQGGMVFEYRFLLYVKYVLVISFSLVIPAALTLFFLRATSRAEGTRFKNPLSMMKEKMAGSLPWFTIVLAWIFHLGLIVIGLVEGGE